MAVSYCVYKMENSCCTSTCLVVMGIEWWSGGSEFESRMLLTYTDNYTDYFTAKLHRLKRAKKYKAKRGRDYPIYINKGNFFGNWAMRWEPVRRRRRRRRRRWKCLFLYPTAYYKCKQLRLKERKKEPFFIFSHILPNWIETDLLVQQTHTRKGVRYLFR